MSLRPNYTRRCLYPNTGDPLPARMKDLSSVPIFRSFAGLIRSNRHKPCPIGPGFKRRKNTHKGAQYG